MTERRSMLFATRRVGLTRNFSGGPPLTQVNGRNIQPTKRHTAKQSSFAMKGDLDLQHDPITAPPESSDSEAENVLPEQAAPQNSDDSDKDYDTRRTANIRGTAFGRATSSVTENAQRLKPKIRAPRGYGRSVNSSRIEEASSVAGSKRSADEDEDQPKQLTQLERELEAPRQKKKKKKQPVMKYGAQQQTARRPNASQPAPSTFEDDSMSPASQDSAPNTPAKRSFQRILSDSPMKSQSPRKPFRMGVQNADLDELEDSKPSFRNLHDSSPASSPVRRRLRHISPETEYLEEKGSRPARPARGLRNNLQATRALSRQKLKRQDPSSSEIQELTQQPVFKVPELEDSGMFDSSFSLDAAPTPEKSEDVSWDQSEIEEVESTTTPRCPMCYEEIDRELLEQYGARGKMSVKQQTAFCRLHKRRSAEATGAKKGYPKIDWETLNSRLNAHQAFLKNILEGTQKSHYREVLKEKVDSGKNRTLLTSHDNLTPGYYGPRGLQVMTEFIMSSLSDVIRRRAVEDKLISARSYTGYVQTVLVPELTVRLIIEDMAVTETRAREVLEESVEIGELLHEETRDVVSILERQDEDSLLEI
ncbi:RTC4-like domain-containing protein [Nemania sp. FL0916]|nr:RTC4-like domain-containing protein [Nemania sp. FL0916]